MNATQDNPTASEIDDWQSLDEVYEAFVNDYPMLALQHGKWAAVNIRRNFGPRLIEAGAVRHLVNRAWIAHKRNFGPALFDLLHRTTAEIDATARARKGSQG